MKTKPNYFKHFISPRPARYHPKRNFIPIIIINVLLQEGYGTKIKGIHFINAPSFVDKFVSLVKQGLKEKVANRLHVHNTCEDLHKEISREILPKEYGGDGPSCEKLAGCENILYFTLLKSKYHFLSG